MSDRALTQCAAVNTVRASSTSAEQKPALSAPRSSSIATRSAKRASGDAPTSAPAGAAGIASAMRVPSKAAARGDVRGMAGFMRSMAAKSTDVRPATGLPLILGLPPRISGEGLKGAKPLGRQAGRRASFTLHSAGYANIVSAVREQGLIVAMAALAVISRAAVLSLTLAGAAAHAAEVELRPASPPKLLCLSAAETREVVRNHRLLEPFTALKFAAAQRKAEALSAKLCHTGDEFIYEITMLHRDGRLVHVEMEAGSGKLIPRPPHESHDAHDAHEPPVKN